MTDYQPFYCEENVWKLCDRGVPDGSLVIFISNARREVMLLLQKAGDDRHGVVVFDYHVILVERHTTSWQVCDLDSRLGSKSSWPIYRKNTFPQLPLGYEDYGPMFRVIPAMTFHEQFASDRRHMLEADGSWSHPPPPWPAIGQGSNLMEFVEMQQSFVGEVVDLDALGEILALP